MLTNTKPTPIAKSDRILYLDILRGLAILFIFLANTLAFSGWWDLSDAEKATMSSPLLDLITDIFCTIFIDGKWYSVFSILFGIGLVVQLHSFRNRADAFPRFFTRRMLGLLFIGGVHLFLLWPGDILALYALIGLAAIAFRNTSDRNLIRLALVLLCLPILNWVVLYPLNWNYVNPLYNWFFTEIAALSGGREDGFRWMLENTDLELFSSAALKGPVIRLAMLLESGRFFKVLALFCIGMWAGRGILYGGLLENRSMLRKIAMWGFVIGIPMNFLRGYVAFGLENSPVTAFLYELFYSLGTVPLACGYAALLALALQKSYAFWRIFAPVGRMALSNYLGQTIISIGLYYGIGLGLAFRFGLSESLLIALGIYMVQIAFSTMWLRYFQYGPIEWIWRQLTYGKFIALRKK